VELASITWAHHTHDAQQDEPRFSQKVL